MIKKYKIYVTKKTKSIRQKILRQIIKIIEFSSINIGINQGKDKKVFLGEKDMEADAE